MYRWLDHTSEREAAIALGDLLREHPVGEAVTHPVEIEATDHGENAWHARAVLDV